MRLTVETAALISAQSNHFITRGGPLPAGALQSFWNASKSRLNAWLTALELYPLQVGASDAATHQAAWQELQPLLAEIFTAEILTRLWGAMLVARDRVQGGREGEPIARNVLLAHLDVRRRALRLLVSESTNCEETLNDMDRLLRKVERWTDLLIGHLVLAHQLQDFAFDSRRALEFGQDQLEQMADGQSPGRVWNMLLLSLRLAFPDSIRNAGQELEGDVVRSILACFPSEAFGSDGSFKSALQSRIESSEPPVLRPAAPVTDKRREHSAGSAAIDLALQEISFAKARRARREPPRA